MTKWLTSAQYSTIYSTILSIPLTTESQPNGSIVTELLRPLADKANFSVPQLDVSIEPNIDLSSALKTTLDSPEFYPPLSESVFEGDTVAIALQTDIPHAGYLI